MSTTPADGAPNIVAFVDHIHLPFVHDLLVAVNRDLVEFLESRFVQSLLLNSSSSSSAASPIPSPSASPIFCPIASPLPSPLGSPLVSPCPSPPLEGDAQHCIKGEKVEQDRRDSDAWARFRWRSAYSFVALQPSKKKKETDLIMTTEYVHSQSPSLSELHSLGTAFLTLLTTFSRDTLCEAVQAQFPAVWTEVRKFLRLDLLTLHCTPAKCSRREDPNLLPDGPPPVFVNLEVPIDWDGMKALYPTITRFMMGMGYWLDQVLDAREERCLLEYRFDVAKRKLRITFLVVEGHKLAWYSTRDGAPHLRKPPGSTSTKQKTKMEYATLREEDGPLVLHEDIEMSMLFGLMKLSMPAVQYAIAWTTTTSTSTSASASANVTPEPQYRVRLTASEFHWNGTLVRGAAWLLRLDVIFRRYVETFVMDMELIPHKSLAMRTSLSIPDHRLVRSIVRSGSFRRLLHGLLVEVVRWGRALAEASLRDLRSHLHLPPPPANYNSSTTNLHIHSQSQHMYVAPPLASTTTTTTQSCFASDGNSNSNSNSVGVSSNSNSSSMYSPSSSILTCHYF